jgi:hypothetical protein
MNRRLVITLIAALSLSGAIFGQVVNDNPTIINEARNPQTKALIGESREWIWIREQSSPWRKLIPGRSPQWFADGAGFFYFLDVGYDGDRTELWSAHPDGEARLRLTRSDYFIWESPVVSANNRRLAYRYQTSQASGDFRDIVIIDLPPRGLELLAEGKVVFRTKAQIVPKSLRWDRSGRLYATVDGIERELDTSVPGTTQLP